MMFCLSDIFAIVTLTLVVASHAASVPLPSRVYWNSVLPNTPMPKAISELVQPDFITTIGNRVVYVDPGKKFFIDVQDIDNATFSIWSYIKDAPVHKQVLVDRTRRVYFFESDIHMGTTMRYRLGGNSTRETFLSRKTADAIPFSSSKLPEILKQVSVKPGSFEAEMINDTILHCECSAMRGEEKYCATSLESMIDFTTSKLGTNVQVISPEVEKGAAEVQNYTIALGVKKLPGHQMVACHKMVYEYAVYYCHELKTTRAYVVPMEGADGTKAKAIAFCHVDTSDWNPTHYAFRELNIKPGITPICHFIRNKNVVWFRNQKPA